METGFIANQEFAYRTEHGRTGGAIAFHEEDRAVDLSQLAGQVVEKTHAQCAGRKNPDSALKDAVHSGHHWIASTAARAGAK